MIRKEILILGLMLIGWGCSVPEQFSHAQKESSDSALVLTPLCIAFYNVENLFDTIDQGNKDEEFLPHGAKRWNTEKYHQKLSNMAKVIYDIGLEYTPDGAAVVGLAEVENDIVLHDLVTTPPLKNRGYRYIILPSPDERGVDVALIYQSKYFVPADTVTFRLRLPDDTAFKTRDQLMVEGNLLGEKVYFMVAHWPSRRGGTDKSEYKRIAAAELARRAIDSVFQVSPGAKIIFMGDLNDDPYNRSVKKIMKADCPMENVENDEFFNPMECLYKSGAGTLKYNNQWNLFDQMLLSPAWRPSDYLSFQFYKAGIYNKPYLITETGVYKGYPYRTFSGNNFIGGYSDHFPVYVILAKKKK